MFKDYDMIKLSSVGCVVLLLSACLVGVRAEAPPVKKVPQRVLAIINEGAVPLGLPPLVVPADNPLSVDKVQLGNRLYDDTRFSADGKVACATCHAPDKGFSDGLPVSEGFMKLKGTRSAPTVINAAYMTTQFWDGREPTLESQSLQPPINPIEGGLANHEPILEVIKADAWYVKMFKKVFGVSKRGITMKEVSFAIASFERTILSGNSRFDQFYFEGKDDALTAQEKRGFEVFLGNGRCVSCHVVEQNNALFTDNKFHNIGVGFKKIKGRESEIAAKFIEQKRAGADVDKTVLSDPDASELGRFAVDEKFSSVGGFKTPTLRDVALTAPYMHDGSLKTLEEVIEFYREGGRLESEKDQPITPFLSGGIKPLDLTEKEEKDLVAFLKSLNSGWYGK